MRSFKTTATAVALFSALTLAPIAAMADGDYRDGEASALIPGAATAAPDIAQAPYAPTRALSGQVPTAGNRLAAVLQAVNRAEAEIADQRRSGALSAASARELMKRTDAIRHEAMDTAARQGGSLQPLEYQALRDMVAQVGYES